MALGRYPWKHNPERSWLERLISAPGAALSRRSRTGRSRFAKVVKAIRSQDQELARLDEREIATRLMAVRRALVRGEDDETTIRAFALVREISARVLGMRHFDSQLIGAWAMHKGMLAEMDTGEGKTLTATLPACTAALSGTPVHIITANEYLASRDAQLMRPVYEALGLSVGAVTQTMSFEERKSEYGCDVTYCTNKQVAFDYLRDRMVLSQGSGRLQLELERLEGKSGRLQRLMLRGLCYAIVDEADSVLIDEARTPLVLSRPGDSEEFLKTFAEGLEMAAQLSQQVEFLLEHQTRRVELTPAGCERVAALAGPRGGIWTGQRRREEMICQALRCLHLFVRDRHYLVRDGKVQIIDESTGRVMPDRSWERGLHQMVQAKEGCEISTRNETLARLSYQRFFQRYLKLAGMSGTVIEVAGELWSLYGLNVVKVPTHRPSKRRTLPTRVYADKERKSEQVLQAVQVLYDNGQPVLIGTPTLADSERLSERLTRAGLAHQVLNARQDQHEAEIVASAGERGRITVATNIAGRGTDIELGPGVAALGGLHVILTERHAAARIDRQLAGRCARQGDPGSFQALLSLEDEIVSLFLAPGWLWLFRLTGRNGRSLPHWAGCEPIRSTQRKLERSHARARRQLLKTDHRLADVLAFAGRAE